MKYSAIVRTRVGASITAMTKRRKLHRGDRVLYKRMGHELRLALGAGLDIFARCTAARYLGRWVARRGSGNMEGVLAAHTEGTIWCRGWTGTDAKALRAANVME